MKFLPLLSLCAFTASCAADTPLPPPTTHVVVSTNRQFFVRSNPQSKTTAVYRSATRGKNSRFLWKMSGFFRVLHLANDGAHLVSSYDGANLLAPDDARPQTVVLRFWKWGRLIKGATLGEMGLKRSNLQRTVSHFAWRYGEELIGDRFEVKMINRNTAIFDVKTGRLVAIRTPPRGGD